MSKPLPMFALAAALSLLAGKPATAGWGPDGCPPPLEAEIQAAPVTTYFLVDAPYGTDWAQVESGLQKAGALSAKPRLKDPRSPLIEIAISAPEGTKGLLEVFSALGHKAQHEPVETWTFPVDPSVPAKKVLLARAALQGVEGVTGVALDKDGLTVSGYVPHVSTADLQEALTSAGFPEMKPRTEEVRLVVKGTKTPEDLEEARRRLAAAVGVVEARSGPEGSVLLVRERGRGGRFWLALALRGTGWSAEPG